MILLMPERASDRVLTDDDLPPMFRSADSASMAGQRNTIAWSALQLALLIVGAVLGGFDIWAGGLNLGALAAAVSLALSLIPALWLAVGNPQRTWYRGRAAAESVRTLAWKFAVRAVPFAGSDDSAETRLLQDMAAIRRDLRDVGWLAGAGGPSEITDRMRRLRQQPLDVRQQAYVEGRLVAEHSWYSRKAEKFTRSGNLWTAVSVIATAAGLVGGFLRAVGVIDYDGLGSASAVAAAATTWMQLKQFRPLAAAYGLTARELLAVKAGMETLSADEAEWARRCSEAEDAISREHTMWLARRSAS
jgi:hypothetical protein